MRGRDLDKERSEQARTLPEFLKLYNENLPSTYRRVTTELLEEFKDAHKSYFKSTGTWTLELHRKRVMDWLRARAI